MNATVNFITSTGNVIPFECVLQAEDVPNLYDLEKKTVKRVCESLLVMFSDALRNSKECPQITTITIVCPIGDGKILKNIHRVNEDFEPLVYRVFRLRTINKEYQLMQVYYSYSQSNCKQWIQKELAPFDKYIILLDSDFKSNVKVKDNNGQ
jgi:hypothetical protein